jgi:hypothetical protein
MKLIDTPPPDRLIERSPVVCLFTGKETTGNRVVAVHIDNYDLYLLGEKEIYDGLLDHKWYSASDDLHSDFDLFCFSTGRPEIPVKPDVHQGCIMDSVFGKLGDPREESSRKPEFVIAAAIWYKDIEQYIKKPVPHGFGPRNIRGGVVFSGWRHPNCLYQMTATTGLRQSEVGEYVQGFITSHGNFVDRVDGATMAIGSGQINKLNYGAKLFSEDLY